MIGGQAAPARRVYFPGTHTTALTASTNYFDLLDAATGYDVRGDAGNDTPFGDGADDVLRGNNGIDVCDGGTHVSGVQAFSCETVIDVP